MRQKPIEEANIAAKPVQTVTQMLESMIKAPRSTRAEASDVANAVPDGPDAVMLSGEGADDAYPINAVTIMAKICAEAGRCIDYKQSFNDIKNYTTAPLGTAVFVVSSVIRNLQTVRGVWGYKIPSYQGSDSVIQMVVKVAKENHLVKTDGKIICIHSTNEDTSDESNIMKIGNC